MQHVAIQISAPSSAAIPSELGAALVKACTVAVREGDCALVGDRPEMQRNDVAIVRWEAGERDVSIVFTGRVDGGSRSLVRSLTFGDADERLERWRTVGLTIATLAGEVALVRIEEPQSPKPEPTVPHADETPVAKPPPQPAETKLWLDVGGLAGTALDTASPRLGVWADVGIRLGRSAFVGVAGLDYSVARGEPFLSVQWLAGAAGLGVQAGSTDRGLMFEGSALFAVERQQVSASDGARADSETVFGFGGRARAALVWKLGVFSPLLGAQGWLNATPVRVLVHDQYAGGAPRAGGAILLGVRARLD